MVARFPGEGRRASAAAHSEQGSQTMSYRIAAALMLLPGAALAQDDPRTVGVSVNGTLVEVPAEQAAAACGVDAETLLAEWAQIGTEQATMANTSVAADATDLAPEVAADTPLDAAIDGESVADGADATHGTSGGASGTATDVASDAGEAGDADGPAATASAAGEGAAAASADAGAGPEATAEPGSQEAAAGTGAGTGAGTATADAGTAAEGGPATPTEGTTLSKAAVCEVSEDTAAEHGIPTSG